LDVNAFVLYGLPNENIDRVVKTTLFVSEIVGSIIPMLFTPVPSTALFNSHLPYFKARGWDKNLQMLNGKYFPFLDTFEGALSDYVDLQRLMFTLNMHYRSKSYRLFGDSKVNMAFRENIRNGFESFVRLFKETPVGEEPVGISPNGHDQVQSALQQEGPVELLPVLNSQPN
jgi:radical SAM superfamily enzyme YgiQ (UPF0313 family)